LHGRKHIFCSEFLGSWSCAFAFTTRKYQDCEDAVGGWWKVGSRRKSSFWVRFGLEDARVPRGPKNDWSILAHSVRQRDGRTSDRDSCSVCDANRELDHHQLTHQILSEF
jgi:hypothetical protein